MPAERLAEAEGFCGPLLQPPPLIAGRAAPKLHFAATKPSAVAEQCGDAQGQNDGSALIASLVKLKVGGSFWGGQPELGPQSAVVRPRCRQDLALIEALDVGDPLVLSCPSSLRPPASSRRNLVLSGAVDPWHLLDRSAVVIGHDDDPLVQLARLTGRPVLLLEPQPMREPGILDEAGRTALARRLLQESGTYRDPFDGHEVDAAAAIQILGLWRRWLDENRSIKATAGMRAWKRRRIDAFLQAPGAALPTHAACAAQGVEQARRGGGALAIWPSRVERETETLAHAAGVPLVRVEDGFLRSRGLGCELVLPQSIVLDRRGIYFDPRAPSDLEHILQTTCFSPDLVTRASALRRQVVEAQLGKYGPGPSATVIPAISARPRTILVVGQVEDDLSVQLGGGGVDSDLMLMRRVRTCEPDAKILYKPHPDVLAGLRAGRATAEKAARMADIYLDAQIGVAQLLPRVDAVHTISSLAGFEALLRGVEVVCHGQPFYAGWGLTRDLAPVARRTRKLSIDELVAGTLILYPRYLDPVSGLPCEPELLVRRLLVPEAPTLVTRARRLQGRLSRTWRKAA